MMQSRSEPRLHRRITEAVDRDRSSLSLAYEPDADFLKVVEAGRILHWNPYGEPLSTRKLSKARNETFLQQTFRTVVNDSLTRLPHSDFAYRKNAPYEGTCIAAEHYFGELLSYMRPDRTIPATVSGRLITRGEEPVMLQKGQGSTTALSLQELTVDGVRWPKGMLFGVHVASDANTDHRYSYNGEPGEISIVSADEVVGIDPLRPMMYALPPEERTQYYTDKIWNSITKGPETFTSEALLHRSMEDVVGQVALYASLTADV